MSIVVDSLISITSQEDNRFIQAASRGHPNRRYAFDTANPWYRPRAAGGGYPGHQSLAASHMISVMQAAGLFRA
jgi:hypothetical protein